MQAKDALNSSLDMSERVIFAYLDGLSDDDLLLRPIDGMNHIAWQVGHLIASERNMLEGVKPGSSPALPDGFEDGHGRQQFGVDDRSKFLSVERYRELWTAQRAATKSVLDSMSETDLDAPAPERMRKNWPTVGSVFSLMGSHGLMHCGQFVAVRRKLGKPVAI